MTEPFPPAKDTTQDLRGITAVREDGTRYSISAVPPPYSQMTERELLRTMAVDSERTALATEKLLSLMESSLLRSPKLPSLETPDSEQDAPTTPQLPASLTEFFDVYRLFRLEVLHGRAEVSERDAYKMNEIDKVVDGPNFTDVPEQLLSAQGDTEEEVLANGLKAPRYLIEALNDLDRLWPGASIYEARPAIVAHIVSAQNARAKTLYPFCMNDDPNVPAKGSPCIKRKGHTGRHQDNDDGSWP